MARVCGDDLTNPRCGSGKGVLRRAHVVQRLPGVCHHDDQEERGDRRGCGRAKPAAHAERSKQGKHPLGHGCDEQRQRHSDDEVVARLQIVMVRKEGEVPGDPEQKPE